MEWKRWRMKDKWNLQYIVHMVYWKTTFTCKVQANLVCFSFYSVIYLYNVTVSDVYINVPKVSKNEVNVFKLIPVKQKLSCPSALSIRFPQVVFFGNVRFSISWLEMFSTSVGILVHFLDVHCTDSGSNMYGSILEIAISSQLCYVT